MYFYNKYFQHVKLTEIIVQTFSIMIIMNNNYTCLVSNFSRGVVNGHKYYACKLIKNINMCIYILTCRGGTKNFYAQGKY